MVVHHIINNIDLSKGGAQRVVRQLHSGLRSQNIDTRLVALCDSVGNVTNAVSFQSPSPYSWRAFAATFQYIRQQCKPTDIIHAHLFPALLYVAVSAKLLGRSNSIVCTEHNTSNRRREHVLGKFIDWLVYPAYQQIYCISQGTLDALSAWMPSQKGKLQVVENGVTLSCDRFFERKKKNKLIVVSAGRLHPQKNYATALRAIALLKDLEIEYRIAGIGPEEEKLRSLCTQLGLDKKVKFCGYVEDIDIFLQQADIFLMPSLWEGFGLAAVEAMNAGLPVVASNVPGIREILNTSDPCGILVSPDSPREIAHAIKTFLYEKRRLVFGYHAFERSLCFSKARMVDSYRDEYARLTHSGNLAQP